LNDFWPFWALFWPIFEPPRPIDGPFFGNLVNPIYGKLIYQKTAP